MKKEYQAIKNAYEIVRGKVESVERSLATLVLDTLTIELPKTEAATISNQPRIEDYLGRKEWQ